MGLFDLFGREPKTKNQTAREEFDFTPERDENVKAPVSVFAPTSYSDVEKIIDCLKTGKTAIVHLTNLKTETAVRIIDMLSGAIYALGGGLYEMQTNVFMFSPSGLEVF